MIFTFMDQKKGPKYNIFPFVRHRGVGLGNKQKSLGTRLHLPQVFILYQNIPPEEGKGQQRFVVTRRFFYIICMLFDYCRRYHQVQ